MDQKRPVSLNQKKLLTPIQFIVLGYLLFAFLGAVLLNCSFALQPGVKLGFIDSLFTAASAVSVTGLSTVVIKDTFSTAGQTILAFLIQFGGIGIMSMGTLYFIMRGNQIRLRERMMIKADQNQITLQGMVNLILFIFKVTILFELLGALLLTVHFISNYQMPFMKALGMGLFHGISSFTNAGFALFDNSLQHFQQDNIVKMIIGILLLAGSIGFPVLLEVYSNIHTWRKQRKLRFSLYTKITTITFGLLVLAGFVFILLAEHTSGLGDMAWPQKIGVAFFQSLTARSCGFSTIDINVFSSSTLLFLCLMMFIGASPSSCGGGIRTTTFAVLLLSLVSYLKGRTNVKVFQRELYPEDILKSLLVFFLGVSLVVISVIALSAIENFSTEAILFEVCSAFGTTGLSMGITSQLSNAGKAIIIAIMLIGRIGLISLLLLFQARRAEDSFHYVREHIIIGQ